MIQKMQIAEIDIDYSIVICTFNPDERILKRCLQAVANLNRQDLQTEVLLVDNNSPVIVEELSYVRVFSSSIVNLKIIRVLEQGVKFARMAAISLSRGRHIVYIDTDNEPDPDYLQQLKMLNKEYPQVAAWGPGNVTVDFIDFIDSTLEPYARVAFQEKHFEKTYFENKYDWQNFYPVGTGLCTVSEILRIYLAEAMSGRYTLPGRKEEQLSSGEDTQMILLAIRSGFHVGSSPALKLKHIIPASRSNRNYLRRLAFGTSSCYDTCVLEVFPEMEKKIRSKLLTPTAFTRFVLRKWIGTGFGRSNEKTFVLIQNIGLKAGTFFALDKPLPRVVQWIIKLLKVV